MTDHHISVFYDEAHLSVDNVTYRDLPYIVREPRSGGWLVAYLELPRSASGYAVAFDVLIERDGDEQTALAAARELLRREGAPPQPIAKVIDISRPRDDEAP